MPRLLRRYRDRGDSLRCLTAPQGGDGDKESPQGVGGAEVRSCDVSTTENWERLDWHSSAIDCSLYERSL